MDTNLVVERTTPHAPHNVTVTKKVESKTKFSKTRKRFVIFYQALNH